MDQILETGLVESEQAIDHGTEEMEAHSGHGEGTEEQEWKSQDQLTGDLQEVGEGETEGMELPEDQDMDEEEMEEDEDMEEEEDEAPYPEEGEEDEEEEEEYGDGEAYHEDGDEDETHQPSMGDSDMSEEGLEATQPNDQQLLSPSSSTSSHPGEDDIDCDEYDDQDDQLSDCSSEDTRTDAQLAAIALEIRDLEAAVPLLRTSYHLLDRLGEGTFSSVYKAIDVNHTLYDNSQWAPPSPPDSSAASNPHESSGSNLTTTTAHTALELPARPPSPSGSASSLGSTNPADPFTANSWETAKNPFTEKLLAQGKLRTGSGSSEGTGGSRPSRKGNVYVALKRIYVTSSPQRILNELDLLAELREARNVAYLIQAIRHEDQVIAVMPYQRHQDFRTYYRTASLPLIRAYLTSLLRALADTHAKGILHRDVKPANFLFDTRTGTGYLCDFGLAEKVDPRDWYGKCLHSLPDIPNGDLHGHSLPSPMATWTQVVEQWKNWREKFNNPLVPDWEGTPEAVKCRPWAPEGPDGARDVEDMSREAEESGAWLEGWGAASVGGLFGGGMGKKHLGPMAPGQERVGLKKDDSRPSARANRAGTRGFRAPEVLLKCPDQTVALDMWSVGIIMLCFLTRRFPFFDSNDDTEALMEIAAIFGRRRLEVAAIQHNRTVVTNIPDTTKSRFSSIHGLVRNLNPSLYAEHRPNPTHALPTKSALFKAHKEDLDRCEAGEVLDPYSEEWYEGSELWKAVQLMKACLTMECTKRIKAEDALESDFLKHTGDYHRQ